MKRIARILCMVMVLPLGLVNAQTTDEMVEAIVTEATENSQLEYLAHQLTDVIGPRLARISHQEIFSSARRR